MIIMCRVFSCVVGRGCLLCPVHSLGKTVSLWPALFCTPRPNLPVTPGSSWLPTFAFQSPIMKRTSFLVLVLWGLVGLHRTVHVQLLQITGRDIDLDYCDIKWFSLETDRDHSVVFEITSTYCISDSFVDHVLWPCTFFSSTLAASCEELTHWKRLWCWEGLGAGGEGDGKKLQYSCLENPMNGMKR